MGKDSYSSSSHKSAENYSLSCHCKLTVQKVASYNSEPK